MLRNWDDVSEWYKKNGFPFAAANMGDIRYERQFWALVSDIVSFDAINTCLKRNLAAQRKFNRQWDLDRKAAA
jgi:hypothetical protein